MSRKERLHVQKIMYVSVISLLICSAITSITTYADDKKHPNQAAHSRPSHVSSHGPKVAPHGPSPHVHQESRRPTTHGPSPHVHHENMTPHHGDSPNVNHESTISNQELLIKKHHEMTHPIYQETTTSNNPSNNPSTNHGAPLITHHMTPPSLHQESIMATHQGAVVGSANGFEQKNPLHVVKNAIPSHLSNKFTQANMHVAKTINQQFISKSNHSTWAHNVNGYKTYYHQHYNNNVIQQFNKVGQFWNNNYYHNWYNAWFQWGFFGGFWYPVNPDFMIEDYFYYPDVQWFYVDQPVAAEYYSEYYPSQPVPSDICLQAFPYKHVYFPTDTLRDLLVEVSGLPQDLRCNFHEAVMSFTSQLQQEIVSNFSVSFSYSPNDIVVNYYQNLQNKAIVISGFVSHDTIKMAFEGFLDLIDPGQSISFAPKGQIPTQDELNVLNQLNDRIESLGGDPFTAQEEPLTNTEQEPGTATATQQILTNVPQQSNSAPGP